MILQSLYNLYDRLKDNPEYQIAEPGYSLQKISFRVVLKQNGELFDIQDAREIINGKKFPIKRIVPGGDKPPGKVTKESVKKKVQFLRNDLPFLLGVKITEEENPETKKKEKKLDSAMMEFEAFKQHHLELDDVINNDDFSTVCAFLKNWTPDKMLQRYSYIDFFEGQGLFQIVGKTQYVNEQNSIREYWRNTQLLDYDNNDYLTQCLLSGVQQAKIARLHEPKIKGVKDAQSSGAPIVAFDKGSNAFASYGKDGLQGYNAPVSEEAAFKYGVALNALLDGPMRTKHRFSLGDSTIVFWTDKPTFVEDIFAKFASEGSKSINEEIQDHLLREKLEKLFSAIRKGHKITGSLSEKGDAAFFILGLTGQAKGRVGIRFFHRSTIVDLIDKLRQHFEDIRIERQWKENSKNPDPEFPSFWSLLRQTARDSKEISPILSAPLLRAAIQGTPYPQGIYSAVIRRLRANEKVNYLKACVIKGYLNRNKKMEVSMSLDKERKEPAYRLGRLFATLEKTQSDALGSIGAGLRERFYSSVSATPGTVFPRILRTYQHHLAKLEGGKKVNREKLVQEIMEPLNDFSSHLSLNEQGLFAIGYYHQMQNFYTRNEDKQNQED